MAKQKQSGKSGERIKLYKQIDLYLHPQQDGDLVGLWEQFSGNPAMAQRIFAALAVQAMRTGTLDIENFNAGRSENGTKAGELSPFLIRLRLRGQQYPQLIELWDSLPRRTRSRTFIAMIRSSYNEGGRRINLGRLVSDVHVVSDGYMAEDVLLDEVNTATRRTREAAEPEEETEQQGNETEEEPEKSSRQPRQLGIGEKDEALDAMLNSINFDEV